MYKACIFDLDGTLTDTLDSLTFSVNESLCEMKLPKITEEQCRMFVGNGARVLMEKALTAAELIPKNGSKRRWKYTDVYLMPTAHIM